jgi:hypothetical protein
MSHINALAEVLKSGDSETRKRVARAFREL